MQTSVELLDAVKQKYRMTSDYQLAKRLGESRNRISNYRVGRSTFDETMALKIAHELDLDEGYVLACIAAERAQHEETRKAWERVARRLATAAAIAVCIVPFGTPSPAEASSVQRVAQGVFPALCIMLNLMRRRIRPLIQWLRQLHHICSLNFAPISPY